jgi:hypothetical protein
MPDEEAGTPDQALMREQAIRTVASRFLELASAQRSCVILKDGKRLVNPSSRQVCGIGAYVST